MRTPLVLAAALVICSAVSAVDTPAPAPAAAQAPVVAAAVAPAPTKESIDRLLVAMNVEKMIATVQAQVAGAMKTGIDQTLRGQALSPEQQRIADTLRAKVSATLGAEMSWDKLKPFYTQVYTEAFTQEEVDGLTAFYESPAGKAFVAKVPTAMRKAMALIQAQVSPVLRNLQQSVHDSAQQINELKPKSAAPAMPAGPAAAPTAAPAAKPATP
ncbi:MAG TPA: DUF2059 domain-containing protein [Opitutaceae bacterium]